MLPITSCTVCRRFTQLFQYSIESIVNIIDEILILDDSCEEDVDYTNFAKYSNIKIIKSDEFGNDLGKKKQYLANISKHEIVMRWDDDFILYNADLMRTICDIMREQTLDFVITQNYNISFSLDYVNASQPYCDEIYIYRKGVLEFQHKKGFPDYPLLHKNHNDLLSKSIDECLFLHMSNFKSYESILYRSFMCAFCSQTKYLNYYEWLFYERNKRNPSSEDELLQFKSINIDYIKKRTYPLTSVKLIQPPLNFEILNPCLVSFIRDNFKIIFTNDANFTYEVNLPH